MDTQRVSQFLHQVNARTIALQFHISLTSLSIPVLETLSASFPEIKFLVVGDSAFASCCTDYISAKHISAEGIIHIGHTCNTESAIPALHIPDPFVPDLSILSENISSLPKSVYIDFVGSDEAWGLITNAFKANNIEITASKTEAEGVLFIGNGYSLPMLVSSPSQKIFTLSTAGFEEHDAYKFISKRYHFISKVKDASVFGLLILSIPLYKQISKQVCALIRSHQKAAYPIYMGKVTQGKLGNFAEIDMFVLVGCGHTDLPDNKEFYKPIISVFELEAGLKEDWDWNYSTEFTREEFKEEENRQSIAERFLNREFRGLDIATSGNTQIEEGYSGIASRYKSEFRRTM